MVLDSDAAADPGTVVVHLHYASLAQTAMVGPWRFDLLAFVAIPEHQETLELTVPKPLAVVVSVAVVLRQHSVD